MKRFLLTTASAVALGMAAPAMGQVVKPEDAIRGQSESWIDQIDGNNSAIVKQSSTAASATDSTKGTGNLSIIEQGSYNAAYVEQSGTDSLNESRINQDTENDSSNLNSDGVAGAKVVQTGTGNKNVSRVTQNTTELSGVGGQLGSNAADVWQYGTNTQNTSDIVQDGFANAVVVWQSGNDISNNSTVNQSSQWNNVTVEQK
jgi:trimeric autotransporter adhesin